MSSTNPGNYLTSIRGKGSNNNYVMKIIQNYFRITILVLVVWLLGYFNFSVAWILIASLLYIWEKKRSKNNEEKRIMAQNLMTNEKDAILARLHEVPAWVYFPDKERAEWFNNIIKQAWPYFGDYMTEIMRNFVESAIQNAHAQLQEFSFEKIDLGDIPPRFGGFKTYTENVRRNEILIDTEILYAGDARIKCKVKGITAGIKNLQLHGNIRIVLKPLCKRMPLFGGITVFFLQSPDINFDFTDVANALSVPGITDTILTQVNDTFDSLFVLPNRYTIPIFKDIDLSDLEYHLCAGVLRIEVVEAKELRKQDIGFGAKSDPYVKIRFGNKYFRTHTQKRTLSPVWNSIYEAIIQDENGARLELNMYDKDADEDDALGDVSLSVKTLKDQGVFDSWIPLENTLTGMLHLKSYWYNLSSNSLDYAKDKSGQLSKASAVLFVHVDYAQGVPMTSDANNNVMEPSPYCLLKVGQKTEETSFKASTTKPAWNKTFQFLVMSCETQNFTISLMNYKPAEGIGSVQIPINVLLNRPNMTMERPFDITNDSGNSVGNAKIFLKIWLKIMVLESEASSPQSSLTEDEGLSFNESNSIDKKNFDDQHILPENVDIDNNNGDVSPNNRLLEEEHPSLRQRPNSNQDLGWGKIQISVGYIMERSKLKVVIHKCRNLRNVDKDNLSDPYVKLYLLPERTQKRKSVVIRNNLDPEFEDQFEWQLSLMDATKKQLEVTVNNDRSFMSNEQKFLGQTIIDLSKLDLNQMTTEWYTLSSET
ncbi:hypothetical protein SNEBB_008442 [Seison nebaliae]|nr:hypothetical protein SNEBB_008442 [Seison nebaliae]